MEILKIISEVVKTKMGEVSMFSGVMLLFLFYATAKKVLRTVAIVLLLLGVALFFAKFAK